VKTHEGYAKKAAKNDCFWLLRQIKSVTLRFNKSNNGFLSLLEAQNSFLSCKQLIGQSINDFPDCLVGWAKNIETHGRTVVVNYELIPENDHAGNTSSTKCARNWHTSILQLLLHYSGMLMQQNMEL
jgi:hypothetical protein